MPIDSNKVKMFEEQLKAVELIYNLSRTQIDYYLLSIQRYEEKEHKCQKSFFYRNFYKKVKNAQIQSLNTIVNRHGTFNEIAKPVNNGDLRGYAETLASYALILQSVVQSAKNYETELKIIYDKHHDIYKSRIKSWFYCVAYDT
jgi:hypothetical protein